MPRLPFRRDLFAISFSLCALLVGGGAVGGQALFQGLDDSSGSTTAAQRAWDEVQAIANRHGGQLPKPQALAQEAQVDQPRIHYRATGVSGFDHWDSHGQVKVAVVSTAGDQAELLVAQPRWEAVRVAGAVGQTLPGSVHILHPHHVDWSQTPYYEGGAILLALLLAFWFERSVRKGDEQHAGGRLSKWREHVPDLNFGPADPIDGFTVIAAKAIDDADSGEVVFTAALLKWSQNGWVRERFLHELEVRLPVALGPEEITSRWFSYCTKIAHGNAELWAKLQAALPVVRAELEERDERRRGHVPLADLLPQPAEIAQALPLQGTGPLGEAS